MRTRLLTAAAVAAMAVLLPNRSQAQSPGLGGARPDAAYVIVDRLLMHRGELALSEGQVHDLAALSLRLREDRGQPRIVGFDRVPGKSVPRIERVRPTADDARRLALRLLSPEQRREAAALLNGPEPTHTAWR